MSKTTRVTDPLFLSRSVASEVGINPAIIYQRIAWLCAVAQEEGDDKYVFDNVHWVRQTATGISRYTGGSMSTRTIERCLDKLVESGLVLMRELSPRHRVYTTLIEERDALAVDDVDDENKRQNDASDKRQIDASKRQIDASKRQNDASLHYIYTKNINIPKTSLSRVTKKHTFLKDERAADCLDLAYWFHNEQLDDDDLASFEHALKTAPDKFSTLNLNGAQEIFMLLKTGENIGDIRKTLEAVRRDSGGGRWNGWKRNIVSLSGLRKKNGSGIMKYFMAKGSLVPKDSSVASKLYTQDEASKHFLRFGNGRKFSEMFTWHEKEGKYTLND